MQIFRTIIFFVLTVVLLASSSNAECVPENPVCKTLKFAEKVTKHATQLAEVVTHYCTEVYDQGNSADKAAKEFCDEAY